MTARRPTGMPEPPTPEEAPRSAIRRRPVTFLLAGGVAGTAVGASGVMGLRAWRSHREQTAQTPAQVAAQAGTGVDGSIDRAAMARAIHRWAGSPEVTAATPLFTDLPEDGTDASALQWLGARGAAWGDERMRVHPAAQVTVAELLACVGALLPSADLSGIGGGPGASGDSAEAPATAEHLQAALAACEAALDG